MKQSELDKLTQVDHLKMKIGVDVLVASEQSDTKFVSFRVVAKVNRFSKWVFK